MDDAISDQRPNMYVATSLDHLSGPPPLFPVPAPAPPRLGRLPARALDHPVSDMSSRLVELLRALDTARGRTVRVARLIPEGLLDWAPTRDAFTCADIVRHLAATERFLFVEVAMGRPSRYPGHDRSLAYGREGVLAYLDDLHEQSMRLLETLSDAALDRTVTTLSGAQIPTWRWIQLAVEHEAHHRGQLYLMLRLRGVATPPLFGVTEEHGRDKSR